MLEFSWKNVSKDIIGEEHGLDIEKEFSEHKEQIAEIISGLYERKEKHGQWLDWMNLAYNEETVWYIKEYASQVKDKFENLLILGLGGSAIGSKAVTEALLKPYWNMLSNKQRKGFPKLLFIDNIDPDQINGLLDVIDLKKTLVNVITKSGSTAETMSAYMIIKDRLKKELGEKYRKNIVTTTDKHVGILRQLAQQEGYKNFVIPEEVCGRYSAFTPVGLLPFALLGLDIEKMLEGVKDMDKQCQNTDINKNYAAQNALIHYLMDKKGKNISVMMPYSNRLRYIADWYIALWAESLGKEYDLNGNEVNSGPTPIKAVGVTDQHSQIQLYNEGPNDKVINFIRVKEFDTDLTIPHTFDYTGIGYLCDKKLSDLMNAEADATKVSLNDYKRPNVTFTIPKIDEYNLGQLLYLLQMQTAITGSLYNIDAFNQPGVEQAKNYTYALMGRIGYEGSAKELKEKIEIVK